MGVRSNCSQIARVMPQGTQYKLFLGGFQMKTKNKALLLTLCAVVLVAASVLGTMAYLTSADEVKNTFTLGAVSIALDEAEVHKDGTYVTDHSSRVKANEYHLLPGHEYIKDPTVTVKSGSESSYIRMVVTINKLQGFDAIFAPVTNQVPGIFCGVSGDWTLHSVTDHENDTRSYEFRYKETVAAPTGDVVLDDLFETITIPGTVDAAQLEAIADFKIDVVAQAIQADGFENADAAWAAFNQ